MGVIALGFSVLGSVGAIIGALMPGGADLSRVERGRVVVTAIGMVAAMAAMTRPLGPLEALALACAGFVWAVVAAAGDAGASLRMHRGMGFVAMSVLLIACGLPRAGDRQDTAPSPHVHALAAGAPDVVTTLFVLATVAVVVSTVAGAGAVGGHVRAMSTAGRASLLVSVECGAMTLAQLACVAHTALA